MRHLYDSTRLNRSKSHRKALLSNLSASLFLHKRIITTLAKAKYARRFAERMITFARDGSVAARRHVLRHLHHQEAVKFLFSDLGPHFKHRSGGYTRIIKIGPRQGDAAPMAILELVGFDDAATESAPKKPSKSRLKAAQKETVVKKVKEQPVKVEETDATPVSPEETEAEEQKADATDEAEVFPEAGVEPGTPEEVEPEAQEMDTTDETEATPEAKAEPVIPEEVKTEAQQPDATDETGAFPEAEAEESAGDDIENGDETASEPESTKDSNDK